MKMIIDSALSRSRATLLALLMILIAGGIAYVDIPKEADPDIDIPLIYILLKHDGISPEDSERLLLQPVESSLRSIEGVKEVRSSAYESGASIVLEFDAGFDAEKAITDVREKVDLAKTSLPSETKEPKIKEINFSLFPVLVVTLSGNIPERTLLALARSLRDEIGSINTVLDAKLTGNRKELIEVIIDPTLLESYDLDSITILQIIARSNLLVTAGTLDAGNGSFPIKVPGLYENISDILTQPIKVHDGAVVTIGDVANVKRTFKDRDSIARLSGEPSIGLEISKRSGENIIDTIQSVREKVFQQSQHWPNEIKVTFSQDRSVHIHRMLKDLQNNVISAILLVMIIIVGALGWRSGLLVGIAIPGSFLLGILVLATLGFSINIVVLFSLILSVGMLVDGAIVVTEFADRQMTNGLPKEDAYRVAANRMAGPIIASTATTLAAFMPLIFWPGMVGEFMKFLPITLIAILTASLLMALVFIPTLGSKIGKPNTLIAVRGATATGSLPGSIGRSDRFTGFYLQILELALKSPAKIILLALFTLVAVQYTYITKGNGVQFFPDIEPDTAKIYIHARGNLSTEEKAALVYHIEREVLKIDEFKSIYTFVGKLQGGGQNIPKDVIGTIQLEFKDWAKRRPAEVILAEIKSQASKYAGILVTFVELQKGPPTGKPIKLLIKSNNVADLNNATETIRNHLDKIEGLVNIDDDRDLPGIEWQLKVDRAEAAKFEVDVALIGNYVQLITKGLKVTDYRTTDSDEEIDVVIRYPQNHRKLNQYERIQIKTKKGLIPIDNFITWSPKSKVGVIKRVQSKKTKTITADVAPGILADSKAQELKAWLKASGLPDSVKIQFKGEDAEQKQARGFLIKAFTVAIFIMGIILVTQFNSFYSAFLILSAVIMSTAGVFLGLLFTGEPFGIVMSGVGVIALAGIVVNNNIVLIDTFDYLKHTSKSVQDAILLAGAQRLRPVLLTTITTVLGLLPMVFQTNIDFVTREITIGAPSTQWWVSLSTTIVFGLSFATVLTLLVTPCALMLRSNLKDWYEVQFLKIKKQPK
ncbi:efflux RND transporter permease subunit [Rhodospirillaceae bacterium]|nr:efflux RND transporter permease subunit [Rhodospirillaceae bacterium]